MQNSRGPHKQYKSGDGNITSTFDRKRAGCSHCARHPQPKERYPACARCKILVYCSRECQKKDWPEHKLSCRETGKQLSYVHKCLERINCDKLVLPYVRLAFLAEFFHKFTSNPEPRKIWVVTAIVAIVPHDRNHLNELEDIDIPLSSLSGKQMMGGLMFMDIIDTSNTTDHPLDNKSRAIWQAFRDDMDKEGHPEVHVVLSKFNYWGRTLLIVPFAVGPGEMEEAKPGNPKLLRLLNAAISLEAFGGTNPKKWTCVLGDDDQKEIRAWNIARKAHWAKNGK